MREERPLFYDGSGRHPRYYCYDPAALSNASAMNNSIYFSTDNNKLVYKDSAGVVNDLY